MATYTDAIQKLYVAYFTRPADAAGLAYWEGVVAAAKGDTSAVSAAFAASTEYQTEYAQITTGGVISKIYANLFGHAPDDAGLAYWIDAINNKVFTIDQAVTKIAAGAQGTDKVAYDSKVLVATSFTAALDTDAEKAGYSGKGANDAAKTFLKGITDADGATAAIVPAALDAQVSKVVKAGVPFTVTGALASLDAAHAAVDAFLVTADGDNDAKTSTDSATLNTNALTALNNLDAKIGGSSYAAASDVLKAALMADQVAANKAVLDAAKTSVKAASDAVATVAGLGQAIAASAAAVAADKAATDGVTATDIKLAGALASYNKAVGGTPVTVAADGQVTDLIEVKDGKLVLATDITEKTNPGITDLLNASIAKEAADVVSTDAAAAKLAAAAAVTALDAGNAKSGALATANDAVTAANKTITDLATLVTKLGAADALVAQLKGLTDAVADAENTFVSHDFVKPLTLGATALATDAADIFVAGKVDSQITGMDKKDVLFVGTDYQLNTGKLPAGNNAVLEIFLEQTGKNTVVTVETKAYGSETADVIHITLVGVNSTDVHFANGIVTV
ncbi:DUF4214 domain-containing protein [Janthinobacterium sp. 75]|uniref:DUF4214 domain-containing protein n=1 Tax=Janthinobacterium sp. 75 TaxID=2135628 RepID=UPI0010641B17|nr:DUF4214 domain-containing protein [Janthinobacterium sp. 75]TDY34058.1 uncharacterized protein DUF4214 [Janthinobacterium sp. 75]